MNKDMMYTDPHRLNTAQRIALAMYVLFPDEVLAPRGSETVIITPIDRPTALLIDNAFNALVDYLDCNLEVVVDTRQSDNIIYRITCPDFNKE